MRNRRTGQLNPAIYRVAILRGDRWQLHDAEFSRLDAARSFGAQCDSRGYAVEVTRSGWPVAVLWCDPDLAVEIVQDLITR